jgi:HD superfamily phosphodiesterase
MTQLLLQISNDKEEYKTMIHPHKSFHEKLLLLKDKMNTVSGKAIAMKTPVYGRISCTVLCECNGEK